MQSNDEYHEQLRGGVAATTGPPSNDSNRVRINPIGEGDITQGESGEATYWSPETLREAVESGVFDNATIVKGSSGTNPHHPIDEQVAPDDLLGRVDSWEYREGVGPVGEATVVDEDIADRIEADLLDVSADLYRHLGEYSEQHDATEVAEIVDVPRITVLERGASANASIEPATAEALGYSPAADGDSSVPEQLAVSIHSVEFSGTEQASWDGLTQSDFPDDADLSDIDDHFLVSQSGFPPDNFGDLALEVVSADGDLNLNALESAHSLASSVSGVSDDEADRLRSRIMSLADDNFDDHDVGPQDDQNAASPSEHEQLAVDVGDAVRWESQAGGSGEADDLRYGVVIDGLQDEADDVVLVAVYQAAADGDGWENRNEQNEMQRDTLVSIGSDGVDSLPPVSQAVEQNSDEAAESATTPADVAPSISDTGTIPMADDSIQEQLADARSTVSSLEDDKEQLAAEKADLADDLDEAQEQLSEYDDAIEQKDERIDTLKTELTPIKELLAEIATDGSGLDPSHIAETHSAEQLVDALGDDSGGESEPEPEQNATSGSSYSQKVKEQLGGQIAPRGDANNSGDPAAGDPEYDDEQLAAAEDRAYGVMTGSDISAASQEQLSARDYVAQEKGVDPAAVDSMRELERRVAANEGGD